MLLLRSQLPSFPPSFRPSSLLSICRGLLRRAAESGALVAVLDATAGIEHDTLAAE